MKPKRLTVHETGPDGDSTYQLTIGRDIAVEDAEQVIRKSGGSAVFAMHRYEAGERVTSFVSRAIYDQIRAANGQINSQRRSLDDIKSEIEQRTGTSFQQPQDTHVDRTKPWWHFWR